MREKWTKALKAPDSPTGQFTNTSYFGSLPSRSPSTRAIINYNNIVTDRSFSVDNADPVENYTFINDNGGHMRTTSYPEFRKDQIYMSRSEMTMPQMYDRPKNVAESIVSTGTMNSTASLNETTDSTTKLVKNPTLSKVTSCFGRLETLLSTVCVAAGFGNIYRLPLAVSIHGGAPFLVAYVVLTVVLGLPLIFLELGLGQLVQQGTTKTWRAVPLFKGVGYVKLIASCILCVYYPLYMSLSAYYLIWMAKDSVPFAKCKRISKNETAGYMPVGKSGEECLKNTFLSGTTEESYWFGAYGAILLVIWTIIMLCSLLKTKSYKKSMNFMFVLTVGCLVALVVHSVDHEINENNMKFLKVADWEILYRAEVWYFAAIQLFFSTHLGFGNFVTCAGKVFNKTHPFWTSAGYIFSNLLFGIVSVLIFYVFAGNEPIKPAKEDIIEAHLFTVVYDRAVNLKSANLQIWSVLMYFVLLFAGFISVVTLIFTILKAIRIELHKKWKWWHMTALFCLILFASGLLTVKMPNFQILHLLDHYIVGNLVLIATILEIIAFAYFYGTTNLYMDFEFILGHQMSPLWKLLWWLAPWVFLGIFVWALATISLNGLYTDDPVWMYATGWGVVVAVTVLIVIMAIKQIGKQVDYNLMEKISSSLRPSQKWGPVDPIARHRWVQFRSKAEEGDRDFTLKRRGTRDYTHSVKNLAKYHPMSGGANSTNGNGTLKKPHQEAAGDPNANTKRSGMEVSSIVGVMELLPPRPLEHPAKSAPECGDIIFNRTVLNPLAMPSLYTNHYYQNSPTSTVTSEGYGTIRNGPYVIDGKEMEDHVCWRRNSGMDEYEDATEL